MNWKTFSTPLTLGFAFAVVWGLGAYVFFYRSHGIFETRDKVAVEFQSELYELDDSSRAPASIVRSCVGYFQELVEKGRNHSTEVMAQRAYRALDNQKLRSPQFARRLRDWATTFLTYRNGRDYPVIACDTTPKANFWAKRALGVLDKTAEGSDSLSYDVLNKQILDHIEIVKTYQVRRQVVVDETMTAAAQLLALESAIASKKSHGIVVKYTKYVGGSVAEEAELSLPTMSSVLLHRDRAMARLMATQNIARELNFEQVKTVKSLENFQAEALYYQSLHRGNVFDSEAIARLAEIRALYRDWEHGKLQDEFQPPLSAWNHMKWTQFHMALGERLKAYVPKWHDSEFKKTLDYVKTLTPEERKRLGIDEAMTSVESWSKTRTGRWLKTVRWGNASLATALGTGGVGGVVYGAYELLDVKELMNALFAEKWKRHECANKMAEQKMDEFYSCVDEYLRLVFPETYLLNRDHLIEAVVEGEFQDPEIQEAVDSVVQEGYKAFLVLEKRNAISRVARAYIDRNNVLNSNFDVVLMEMNDEEFLDFYVGQNDTVFEQKDSAGAYIKLKYPLASANKNVRLLVRAIITAQPSDRDQYYHSLKAMSIANELAEHLTVIVERRTTGTSGLSTEVMLSRSLENARKLLDSRN